MEDIGTRFFTSLTIGTRYVSSDNSSQDEGLAELLPLFEINFLVVIRVRFLNKIQDVVDQRRFNLWVTQHQLP